jgi:hypothetical protein
MTKEDLQNITQPYVDIIEALQEKYKIALEMLTPEQRASIQTTIDERRHAEKMLRKVKNEKR